MFCAHSEKIEEIFVLEILDIGHGRTVAMCGLTVAKVQYTMFLFFYLQLLKMGLMMKLKQKCIVVLDFFCLNLSKN